MIRHCHIHAVLSLSVSWNQPLFFHFGYFTIRRKNVPKPRVLYINTHINTETAIPTPGLTRLFYFPKNIQHEWVEIIHPVSP